MSIQFAKPKPAPFAPKKTPAKKGNAVTTLPKQNEITEVATVEQQIEQHARRIEQIQSEASFELGRELAAVRELFKYDRREGGFEGWVDSRLGISRRTAYRMVEIFEGIKEECATLGTLSQGALIEAAKAGPDIQAIIADRVKAGEVFTAAQVKDLKEQAATEAVMRIHADAEQVTRDLAALRLELEAKDKKSADEVMTLQAKIEAQNAKLKAFEDQAAEYQKSLPKPAKAKEQAAETGGVVLGSDGKFHSGSSAEQKRMHDAFMFAFDKTLDLTENPPAAARVAAGCPQEERAKLAGLCDGAIAYLNTIKDALNGQ